MKICEECRQRHTWKRQEQLETADCDLCWTRNTKTSEMAHCVKEQRTDFELRRIIQEQRNEDFHTLAEAVSIFYTYGPKAGTVDQDLTSQLHQIEVTINGQVDWEASYLRRLRMKDAILKDEIRKRDARPELVRV